jgi:sulfate transport system ATP-binding protein
MHVTTIFVTHDQEEAFEVADQVVVMNEGKIEQVGSPESVFEQPGTPFVMDFLGNVNVFHGRVENGNAQIGPFSMDYPTYPHPEPREGRAFVRPHELEIDRCRTSDAALPAKITQVKPAGAITRVRLVARDFGAPIAVELQRAHALSMSLKVGDDVFVRPRSVRLFTEEADYAI